MMFEPTKLEQWYDSLPIHTKEYLKKQAVWHDVDMFKAFAFGIFFGILIGVVLCLQ
jgi:hypothetical protein